MVSAILAYLPVFLLLGFGFAISRFRFIDGASLGSLLHFALFPVFLFFCLQGGTRNNEMVLWLFGFGVGMAAVGFLVVTVIKKVLKINLGSSGALANIATFALPVLVVVQRISGDSRLALALMFVGIALTVVFLQLKARGFAVLIRQPWLYAVFLAALVRYDVIPGRILTDLLKPLNDTAVPIGLIYLGTQLTSLPGALNRDLWLSLVARLVVGVSVAVLVIKFAPIPKAMKDLRNILILGSIAPPATFSASIIVRGVSDAKGEIVAIGTLVVLIAYMLHPLYVHYLY